MRNKLVSIIIPIYNTEEFLDKCICSVLKQTYKQWELLLINDGSTDGSLEVCQYYAAEDARITVISEKNRGVSAARNTGIESSTGDYIMFVDSDDELEADAIEVLLNSIDKYDAAMSYADVAVVKGNIVSSDSSENGALVLFEGDDMLKRALLCEKQTQGLHGKMFLKNFIQNIRFVVGRHINEDVFFLFECYTKMPRVVKNNKIVYRYLVRDDSACRSGFSEKYLDMLYFCELKVDYIQKNFPSLMHYSDCTELKTHLLFLDVLCRSKQQTYKILAPNSIRTIRKKIFSGCPLNEHEKKLATMVVLGLYPLYRHLFKIKFKK